VNAGDELAAPHDLHGVPGKTNVVAGVTRKQDLVPRLHAARLAAHGGDYTGPAIRLGRCREDQPEVRLRLLVRGLDDDEVVERLQGEIDPATTGFLHYLDGTGIQHRNHRS
jgi:hypothetical protein